MRTTRDGQTDLRRYRTIIQRARARMRAGHAAASTPCYLDACLGREQELQQLERWYHTPDAPLLTLTGPSGIGKTHLACAFLKQIQAAGAPCVYVNLTLLNAAEQILASLFHTLDLSFPLESDWQRLVARLFEGGELLVLDDFDRLLPEGAAYVAQLLQAAPQAKILATSQKPLELAAEQVLPLPPLASPPETLTSVEALKQYPSVALVLRQAGGRFQLTPRNARKLAQICARAEGHPGKLVNLGLWLYQDSNALYTGRIHGLLGGESVIGQVLSSQGRSRGLIDTLREEEQRILKCLLVFVDAFDAESAAAAAQVSSEQMQAFLDAMVRNGFLHRSVDSEEPLYRIHRQVRSSIPLLPESQEHVVMERLRAYYMGRLERMAAALPPVQIRQWCFRERNMLHRLLEHFQEQQEKAVVAEVLSLVTRACDYRPPAMVLDWGYRFLEQTPEMLSDTYAEVVYCVFAGLVNNSDNARAGKLVSVLQDLPQYLHTVGRFFHNIGDGNRAHECYLRAREYARSRHAREAEIISALELAESEAVIGNLHEAESILRTIERNPATWRMPQAVRGLLHYVGGYLDYQRGRLRRSGERYEQCLKLGVYVPYTLRELSRVYLELGDYAHAEQCALEGLKCLLEDPEPVPAPIHALNSCLGDLYAVQGRYADALERHLPALEFWQHEGQPRWICWTLNRLAEIELLARDAGHPWRLADAIRWDAHTLLREAWDEIEPTYMNLPHKSRTHHNLGWLAWHEGRLLDTEYHLNKALEIRRGYGNPYGVARTLEILARLRFSQQRYAEARTLLHEASKLRNRIEAKPYPALKRQNLKIHRRRRLL
ncbi:MAG: tetratricopeptide repeat protein [Fimbriimonadales bacterium]|nr:MAG: hypothetical protein KatS3mg018_1385 [Fimbriimonadales bacterium]